MLATLRLTKTVVAEKRTEIQTVGVRKISVHRFLANVLNSLFIQQISSEVWMDYSIVMMQDL